MIQRGMGGDAENAVVREIRIIDTGARYFSGLSRIEYHFRKATKLQIDSTMPKGHVPAGNT